VRDNVERVEEAIIVAKGRSVAESGVCRAQSRTPIKTGRGEAIRKDWSLRAGDGRVFAEIQFGFQFNRRPNHALLGTPGSSRPRQEAVL
jgi:hypothetical protein